MLIFLQKQKQLWFVRPCNFLENQFCKELLLYIVFVENKIEFQNLTRMKLKYNGFWCCSIVSDDEMVMLTIKLSTNVKKPHVLLSVI